MNQQHTTMMRLALDQARSALAKDEFPVGCVIACQDQVIVVGHRAGTIPKGGEFFDEVSHAEIVALQRYYRLQNRPKPDKLTLYCTMEPCLMCFGAILLSGIGKLVWAYEDAMGGGTSLSRNKLKPLYRDRKIEIIPHVLRPDSLALFQEYFRLDSNGYWKDSLLANYTLAQ